jgi:hypothetical protein
LYRCSCDVCFGSTQYTDMNFISQYLNVNI